MLLRIWWMVGGSAALVILTLVVFKGELGVASGESLAMLVVGASMVAARWVDVHRFGGLTADGEPSTPADFRRYAAIVTAVTAVLWGAIHVLG